MKISPEELENLGYRKFETLQHSEIAGFLKPYLYRRNPYMLAYFLIMLLPLIVFGTIIGLKIEDKTYEGRIVTWFFYGFATAFLLVPLHEFIHGMAYKLVGARKITYGANLRKFIFFAMADHFVAGGKEFIVVALSPYAMITLLSAAGMFMVPGYWNFTLLGIIFMHTLFCGGDFALLSYFHENREKELVTFDDVEQKVSYFYEKIK